MRGNRGLWGLILQLQLLVSDEDVTDEATAAAEDIPVIVHLRGLLGGTACRGSGGLLLRRRWGLTLGLGHVHLAATPGPGQEVKGLGDGTAGNVGGMLREIETLLVGSSHGSEGFLVLHGHHCR